MPALSEYEAMLQERLDALSPVPCAELPHVLMLPGFDRTARIGDVWDP